MNVLVADDSQMTRMVAKKTLTSLGVDNVFDAEDGLQALQIFKDNEIDVVFSDWNMPNVTGLQLLQAIRKLDKNVPVIMITTEGSRDKVTQAIGQGVSDYLPKPFTPAVLKEKMKKWVTVPM